MGTTQAPKSVDEYIAAQSEAMRGKLERCAPRFGGRFRRRWRGSGIACLGISCAESRCCISALSKSSIVVCRVGDIHRGAGSRAHKDMRCAREVNDRFSCARAGRGRPAPTGGRPHNFQSSWSSSSWRIRACPMVRLAGIRLPVRPFPPVLAEQLHGVGRANRFVSAAEVVSRAVFIAAPADALGMRRMDGKISHWPYSTPARRQDL